MFLQFDVFGRARRVGNRALECARRALLGDAAAGRRSDWRALFLGRLAGTGLEHRTPTETASLRRGRDAGEAGSIIPVAFVDAKSTSQFRAEPFPASVLFIAGRTAKDR